MENFDYDINNKNIVHIRQKTKTDELNCSREFDTAIVGIHSGKFIHRRNNQIYLMYCKNI